MNQDQQIIQDAIDGGLLGGEYRIHAGKDEQSTLFLDPSFWQAVGRTREWHLKYKPEANEIDACIRITAKEKWHQFIDHLADGDDHETALSKLT